MLRSAPRVVSGISWSMYRVDPGRSGHRRQCAGPRWRPVGAQRVEGPLSTAGAGVGGWSIRWSTCGMGGEDGSVCARYRLQTKGTDWLFRFAMALDRGANPSHGWATTLASLGTTRSIHARARLGSKSP